MTTWKMKSQDFKRLLEDVQDYKCAITGLPLLPENVEIAFKRPISRGGQKAAANVHLVHNSIIKLAREYTQEEIVALAKAILGIRSDADFAKNKWQLKDTLAIRLKIHHFNEASRDSVKKAARKKPLTWGQAYAEAARRFSST